jgi:hypothetical protein
LQATSEEIDRLRLARQALNAIDEARGKDDLN